MNINLRGYREKVSKGQVEIASILGISHEEVDLYEQAPETVPMGLLVKWLQILGVDIATAMSTPTPPLKAIDPGMPYAELYSRLDSLNKYIDANYINTLELPTQLATPDNLRNQLRLYKQKPNVVLTGGFDAGKSHMANALLGSKNLPVGYQPATRVITFIRHIEDRPEWLKKDVLIFNEDFWLKDEKGKQIIDLLLLDNQERCDKYLIQAGSYEILQKYGVHGEYENIAAHAAVVYMNSPLLKACNLIDLPGYSDQPDEVSKDVEKANSAAQIADALLYASPAKGHINGQDMIRLAGLIRLLPSPENECDDFPTLGNFFIVATHADPSISNEQLKLILEKATKRLYNNLNETVLERRREQTGRLITQTILQSRFFSFWSERPDRCQHLFDELTKTLGEFLPQARISRINREMKAIKEDNTKKCLDLIERYEKSCYDVETRSIQLAQLKALEANEPSRSQETKQKFETVHERIQEFKQNTINSFNTYTQKILTVDSVTAIIRNKYDDKKEAKECLAGYLVEKLQNETEQLVKTHSDKLRPYIEEFLETYTEAILKLPNLNVSINIPFDAKGSFLGGIAGLGSIGALSAWAAALGNLGGYILVAKLVSFLSALGIGFGFTGGTAGVISFVAAIGGPIVLAVGLAAALTFGVWSLFGDSWQTRLAKQTVKYFENQSVCEKFIEGIENFWQDTANSFDKGANAVESDWNKHFEHLHEISAEKTESQDTIKSILDKLQALYKFFANIPW